MTYTLGNLCNTLSCLNSCTERLYTCSACSIFSPKKLSSEYIRRMLKKYPFEMAHNYPISSEEMRGIYANIRKLSLDKTMRIKGLSSLRADSRTDRC